MSELNQSTPSDALVMRLLTALCIAAEGVYNDYIVDTGMVAAYIGEGLEFRDKQDYLDFTIGSWLDEAKINAESQAAALKLSEWLLPIMIAEQGF